MKSGSYTMISPVLLESLEIMGKGMLGIFIVTAVIILVIYLLNTLTKKKS